MSATPKRVLVTVHGIRTFGQWQQRLGELVLEEAPDFEVETYKYGYFNAVAFCVPPLRYFPTRTFRRHLKALGATYPGAEFVIVAHSFGTKIVVDAMAGLEPDVPLRIKLLILAGSVIEASFDIAKLIASGRVQTIINDCGVADNVLLLSHFGVLFTGMAGRTGFTGFSNRRLLNRFFAGGHDLYFQPKGPDLNAFMKRWWLPAICGLGSIPAHDERQPPTWLSGIWQSLILIANPIKLTLYVGLLGGSFYFGWYAPHQKAALEAAQNRSQEAANLLEAGDPKAAAQVAAPLLQKWHLAVPKAYEVLYRALFDSDRPSLTIDVGPFRGEPRLLFQNDGTMVVLTGGGDLTIWSPTGTEKHRKSDQNLSSATSVFTPDNNFIFYHDGEALARMDLHDLSVHEYSYALTDPSPPALRIPEDTTHVIGCSEPYVVGYRLDGTHFPDASVKIDWKAALPFEGHCNVFQRYDDDTIVIGTTAGELMAFSLKDHKARMLDAWRLNAGVTSIDYMFPAPRGVIVNQIGNKHLYLVDFSGRLLRAFDARNFWARSSPNGNYVAYPPARNDLQTMFALSSLDPPRVVYVKPHCFCQFIDFIDNHYFLTLDDGTTVHARDVASGAIVYNAATLPRDAASVSFDRQRRLLIGQLGEEHLYLTEIHAKPNGKAYDPRALPGVMSAAKWLDDSHIGVENWVLNSNYGFDHKIDLILEAHAEGLVETWSSMTNVMDPPHAAALAILSPRYRGATSGQKDLLVSWGRKEPLPGDHLRIEPTGAMDVEMRTINGADAVVDDVAHTILFTFPVEPTPMTCIWVSPDKTRFASGYQDGTVRLWSTKLLNKPLVTLRAHNTFVRTIEAPPSQSRLLSADNDGNIRLWPLAGIRELLAAANNRRD